MRRIREVLRLRSVEKLSRRATGVSVGVSPQTVEGIEVRAKLAGICWPLPDELDDAQLEALLYPPPKPASQPREAPDCQYLHDELRKKGVTLMLLWQEYKAQHQERAYRYSQFCEYYHRYRGQLDVVLRQNYRAGEKGLFDFSGDGFEIVDAATGEVQKAELFVAVLGASNYTYVEAFLTQQSHDWIAGHIHAYEYFGGVPEITVPDCTKTAVVRALIYDPELNISYRHMARHYGTTIIPARPKKPRDKAKVENGVLIAQRWILAALRNHKFFSLGELNEALWGKLEELNGRTFQKLDGNRREMWEEIDRPALKPLPAKRYEQDDWYAPKVNIDYHVEIERHRYSVPYTLVGKKTEARATSTTVEIFFKGRRVAAHQRSYVRGGFTTDPSHRPPHHRAFVEWTPRRLVDWAQNSVGPTTAKYAQKLLETRPYHEQAYRTCLGLMRLAKSYGPQRMEAACERALSVGAYSYRSIESILKKGLDKQPPLFGPQSASQSSTRTDLPPVSSPTAVEHENVRGRTCYH